MTTEVKSVLVRWEKSVKRFHSLDKWSLNEDFTTLSSFIRKEKNKSLKSAVSRCRDLALKTERDYDSLGRALTSAINIISDRTETDAPVQCELNSIGQRERYHDITKSISKERIKCCDSKYLRNLDISILEPKESRMIRRIVEKRMCQEYHRQHKEAFHTNGNKSRHQMRRAVSYQLYNIGQMEGDHMQRESGTHWKWKYDRNIKEWVLKKKKAYRTEEEAEAAANEFMKKHPEEILNVYQCAYCNMYHIGHAPVCEQVAG